MYPSVPPRPSSSDAPDSSSHAPEPVGWLVFKFAANGGVVVDSVERALRDEAVHGALSEAQTWGDFRRMLPLGEWTHIEDLLREGHTSDEDDSDPPFWERPNSPFDPSVIPGFSDGDYPRWAQQCMDDVLPGDLLEEFAEQRSSIHNGSFWFIPHDRADALAEALRSRGYRVEHTPFLRGW
jgi:hypothetical protein